MRLICPNCDAQYEVPDDVMPETGRDVQCSNCGQTWFQHHPDHMPSEDTARSVPAPDEEVAPPPPPPSPAPERERKQLDPAVADILRQEAEAEQEARRQAQQTGLESQPDLGLDLEERPREDDTERRAREARERMARMRGEDVEAPSDCVGDSASNAAALNSRRDLLPDIEEINSTLRASAGRSGSTAEYEADIEAPTHQRKKRGFRTGFVTVLLIVLVLAVFYIAAPRIGAQVPALEGPMQGYVAFVDQMRLWLDDQVRGILQSLDSTARESGG